MDGISPDRRQKRGLVGLLANLLGDSELEKAPETDPLHLAVSVILTEAASIDDDFSDADRLHIKKVLEKRLSLAEDHVDRLLKLARQQRRQNPDLWRFTHQINSRCNKEQKLKLMEEVWRIVLADGVLSRHEDQLAHKLGRLLNLDHPELIRAKLAARESLG